MASVKSMSIIDDSDTQSIKSSFQQIITNFPKRITKKNLEDLLRILFEYGFVDMEYKEESVSTLLAVIFNRSSSSVERVLASSCLHQMAPISDLCDTASSGQVNRVIPCLPVILAQSRQDEGFKRLKEKVISHMEQESSNLWFHSDILSFLSQLSSRNDDSLSVEEVKRIICHFVKWLTVQPPQPVPTKGISRFKKSDTSTSPVELDGTLSTEIYTALSAVDTQNALQELNVYAFSTLQNLLLAMQPSSTSSLELPTELTIPISEQLSGTIRSYCLRIIEQAERRPLVASDVEVQKACLVEAVRVLCLLCYANPSYVPSVLPSVRSLYESNIVMTPTSHHVAVLTASAGFLIRHGGVIMHKMSDVCPYLLKDVVGQCYYDNWISYEITMFIRENLSILCYQIGATEKYFPSLFKILAWNSTCFESDFLAILPACMSAQTAVEIFHTLLDLPCLSASLMIQHCQDYALESYPVFSSLVQLMNQSTYQAMFSFILRPVSGMGDTFNKVQEFQTAVMPLSKHPRVLACSESVIPLLRCYFEVFSMFADTRLTSLLMPAILERSSLLYEVPDYPQKVNSVLAGAVLNLLKDHPDVCTYLLEDFISYIAKEKNLLISEEFYTNLVWAVGEYTNVNFSNVCTPEVITSYYDVLECVVYELLPLCLEKFMFKFLCVAITTLAKLSTSCQDLLPRALLCLGKVGQQTMDYDGLTEPKEILIERVRQLGALLKSPNLASQVLNPPKEIATGQWHRDITAEPFVLKTVAMLVKLDG